MKKINPDIKRASTLPGSFYRDADLFEKVKKSIFARSWQYVGDTSIIEKENQVYPFTFMEGILDEPLILTQSDSTIHCLSNVCTHRGKILVEESCILKKIICGYHGRSFKNNGEMLHMPQFEAAENFPTSCDNLPNITIKDLFGLMFTSLDPEFSFKELIEPILNKISFLPLDTLKYSPDQSKTYSVKANWALYCDNYLEGFHVPFVHPDLQKALDFGKYEYETYSYCNLQIGIANEGEPVFELTEDHPDYGKQVYAYYFWLFPNMMMNFYPWGLSFNYIRPINIEETEVIFKTYKFEGTEFNFEDNNIDQTELEDETVVESVQKGIQSSLYKSGRFSPTMEKCVHHFHTLMTDFINRE